MRAGELRDRIVIEQFSTAKDGYGATPKVWSVFAACWSKVASLSGRELIAAQAALSPVAYTVTMRYLAGVLPKMRIRHGGKLYSIHAVRDVDGFKREMELDCEEGANLG